MRATSLMLLALVLAAPAALAQRVCFDRTDYVTGDEPAWISVGDLNEDGVPDLVVANAGQETLTVLLGTGDATFARGTSFPGGATPRSVALGDVNGDDHLDALVANESTDRVTVHLGDGAGALALTSVVTVGDGPRVVALADFDLDGPLDLAVGHHAGAELRVYFGDGLGGFGAPASVPAPGGIPHLAVADIDLDGDADIVGAQDEFVFVAFVVENLGSRTFVAVPGSFLAGDPLRIVLTDVDEDALPDLVTPSDDGLGPLIEIYRNDGENHFGQLLGFLGYGGVSEVGDFDDDGDKDHLYDKASGPVVVRPGGIEPPFLEVEAPTDLSSATHFAVADLDGDGYDDFAAVRPSTDRISVMKSLGPGFVGLSLSACPGSVSVGDGGRQTLHLGSNVLHPSLALFLLMTTSAGTSPGLPLAPTSLILPLNFSQLLVFTATSPGALIPGSLGFLDNQGNAALELELPAGLDASLAGVTLHDAYVLLDVSTLTATFASNAAPLLLVP